MRHTSLLENRSRNLKKNKTKHDRGVVLCIAKGKKRVREKGGWLPTFNWVYLRILQKCSLKTAPPHVAREARVPFPLQNGRKVRVLYMFHPQLHKHKPVMREYKTTSLSRSDYSRKSNPCYALGSKVKILAPLVIYLV